MKNRTWIIIFTSLILICTVCWLLISNTTSVVKIVGIYQNGSLIEKIDLNSVSEERELKLTGEAGTNIILISHNSIRMKSAECPDKICVNHGELVSKASPIVCLPNKIVIKFENVTDEADAIAGV